MSNRIRELRLTAGITQTELARLIGVNQSAVGKYERAELEPNIELLKKLSNIFECSIDYLVGYTDDFGNITIKSEKSDELSPDSKELLNIFNALDPLHRVQVLEYARYFATRSGVKVSSKNA